LGDGERAIALLERVGREGADTPLAQPARDLLLEWRRK
jgi:hypothetical protein